jgi:hypothetical protein
MIADYRLSKNLATETHRLICSLPISAGNSGLTDYSLSEVIDVRGCRITGIIAPSEIADLEATSLRLIIESSEDGVNDFRPIDYSTGNELVLNIKKDNIVRNIIVSPELVGLAFIRMYITDESETKQQLGKASTIGIIGRQAS